MTRRRGGSRLARAARAALATMLAIAIAAPTAAQSDVVIRGTVSTPRGAKLADAVVELRPQRVATNDRGTRGRYELAWRRHATALPPLRARSAPDGTFALTPSPGHRALAAAFAFDWELVVTATGCWTWRRSLGLDPNPTKPIDVVLMPAPDGPLLVVRCLVPNGTATGFAVVERTRTLGDGSVGTASDVLPLDAGGTFRFAEPPQVLGDRAPPRPVLVEEAYRVTVHAVGMQPRRVLLAAGAHELRLTADGLTPRPIRREDGQPAARPLTAYWQLADSEVALTFDAPNISHLGGRAPTRVVAADRRTTHGAADPIDRTTPWTVAPATVDAETNVCSIDVEVVASGRPVVGAGIWIDGAAVSNDPSSAPFASTDARGRARLRGLRPGVHPILAAHPDLGRAEIVATVADGSAAARLALRPLPAALARSGVATDGPPASVRLDLRARTPSDQPIEVGVVTADGKFVREVLRPDATIVRVDGLEPGPVVAFVRAGDEPPMVIGGILARVDATERIRIGDVAPRRHTFYVRGADGRPSERPAISLGETGATASPPASSRLFRVQQGDQPGQFTVELQAVGGFPLRIHGDRHDTTVLSFPPRDPRVVTDVRLRPAER